ncbi:LamG-like jellyroll fold domain-containing protein [Synoicihabitans lomoniglobus]|uniref:Immunoglobulin domain-containing protein n=1 Tax=Synoicihabitans lomoniglobus TaxID=2909285 RepID=A0AAF0CQD6_9BACT|nr:hypothetical protein [Opitutaceae bacterium LMO-M01]WED66096.1 immunoglobulin domain-containing protein [Opitutaceae bacterium LMO-M01]
MLTKLSLLPGFRRLLLAAVAGFLLPASLLAQAEFAGRYVGSMNTIVSAGGFNLESGIGVYFADVEANGSINFNGVLTGTVSASGAVTFTGGSQFANMGITSATISGGTISSEYGSLVANGTTRYRINASTGYTAAAGAGGGSGGGGGGSGGGGGGTTGDLLAYYSFDNPANPFNDDSGRGVTLAPVNGSPTLTAGRVGNGALSTNGVRLRALVNSSFSTTTASMSYFIKITGAGNWNPRVVAVQKPGTSTHYYGSFIAGTSTGPRKLASYHLTGNRARIYETPAASTLVTAPDPDWTHVAVTHDGSTVRIYLNGEVVLTQANAGAIDTFSSGMLSIAGSDNGLDLFQGALDEIRIFNRELTAAEVTTLSTGGAVGTAVSTEGATGSISYDVIAAPNNLVGYRNRVGQSLQFSITGALSGSVWGSGIYTDDSSLAKAAVHAGVVSPGQTKTVTVNIVAGQSSYPASTANGVTTSSWGAWGGSYSFADASGVTIGQVATTAPVTAANFSVVNTSIALGQRLVLPIQIDGVGPFTYQWFLNGVAINGATANPYVINSVTAAYAGSYSVRVANVAGSNTYTVGSVAVNGAGAPTFVLQPFDKVVAPGGTFALAASAAGSGLSYQWFRNGTALSGETGSILLRNNASANDAGSYTVRVTNSGGSVTSQAATVSLSATASTLRNISVRTNAANGQVITPGFVIRGTGTKRVLIRAIGPGLTQFGLTGVMPNPKVTVYDSNQQVVASNDDWNAATATAISAGVGAFAITPGSLDAALVVDLPAENAYTAQITGSDGQGGLVILEVYDADEAPTSKLVNVSVRSNADSGNDALIMGVSLQGTGKRTLLIRGIGPTLGGFGVAGTIVDPQLTIFDSAQRSVLTNDNWSNADFVYELLEATNFVGAFALGAGTNDSATLSLLDPGNYTIQITPTDGNDGEALAEIYEVP